MEQKLIDRIDEYLAQHKDEIIQTLFALCRIDSAAAEPGENAPYGAGCARALDTALALCEKWGMKTENDDYRCGSALVGSGHSELGVVGHLDIVPAGDGWSKDPFEPYVKDGYAIGRGVCDDKNGVVCGMFAARCITELGIPMQHSLRLIFGCSEETGMDDLPYYLKKRPAPAFTLVPDSTFPVCCGEKGIYSGSFLLPLGPEIKDFSGGLSGATNVVAATADAVVKTDRRDFGPLPASIGITEEGELLHIHATGCPAHASRPEGSVNAIAELAAFLADSGIVSDTSKNSMKLITELLHGGYGEKTPLACEDSQSGKLTCISGRLTTEEGRANMRLDIRYPVTDTGERVSAALMNMAQSYGVSCVCDHFSPPYYHDKGGEVVSALMEVYKQITGRDDEPYVMGGGTYARHLPNAAGFGPEFPGEVKPFPKGRGGCHEPDECQNIEDLIKAIKIYTLALIRLDTAIK